MFGVHADLMRSARLQHKSAKGVLSPKMQHRFIIGNGYFSLSVGQYRHFKPIRGVSADIRYHAAAVRFQVAFQQGVVSEKPTRSPLNRDVPRAWT